MLMRPTRSHLKRAFLVILVLFLGLQGWFAVQVFWYRSHTPEMTAFMEEGLQRLRKHNPHAHLLYHYVPYQQISPELKRAAVAAEDSKFVHHFGFDLDGIEHALKEDLRKGETVAGGSTISQQLAKNLFLSPQRSWLRKGEEALITLMIESMMSKKRILELYLNVVEWGNGIYGAEAAAQHYFGVRASQLDKWQAARLASMLPDPRYYQRVGETDWLQEKTGIVQRRMPRVAIPHTGDLASRR